MNIFQFILHITVFIDRFLVPLIFAIAFIVFIWGVFKYFIAGGADTEGQEKGRQFIMYGLIGFVVMIAVWGIVNLLVNSLGLNPQARPNIPTSGAYEQSLKGSGDKNLGPGGGGGGWFNWGFTPTQEDPFLQQGVNAPVPPF